MNKTELRATIEHEFSVFTQLVASIANMVNDNYNPLRFESVLSILNSLEC